MPRYFFDTRDGDAFVRDEEGLVFGGIARARDEATRALADFAHDALPKAVRRELAIEVRDEADRHILRASLWFEVLILVPATPD
jgi:hypothetical protein